MSRTIKYVQETCADLIMLFDGGGSPKTGEAASFVTVLQKNGAYDSSTSVTITEIDSSNLP